MVTKKLILLSIGLISINTMANQYYVAPPTSSTRGMFRLLVMNKWRNVLKSITNQNG